MSGQERVAPTPRVGQGGGASEAQLDPARVFGRVVLCVTRQAGNAPLIDGGGGRLVDEREWGGYFILLAPWRRDRWGERPPGPALAVGITGARVPQQPHTLLTRSRRPRLRALGGRLR